MKESKNHHYNPRSILRRFTNSDDSVVILNKNTNKIFTNSIDNTGSENYFNTIRTGESKLNFEILFDELDGKLALLITKIVNDKSIKNLNTEELNDLALVVAVQYIRTKIKRTETQDVTKKINASTRKSALRTQAKPIFHPELNDEEIKILTIMNLSNIKEIHSALINKDIVLADCSNCEKKFMTSDNPVVLGTSLDHGQIGLNEKGVEIFYPISPNYCLTYYCKSIRNNLSLVRTKSDFIDKLLLTIEKKENLKYLNKNVNSVNHLQLINSSQFLYSNNDDFIHEQDFLKLNPEYCKLKSRYGELSNESPQLDSLPLGEFVVFTTQEKSFKISVYDVKSKMDFSFRTDELAKFNLFTDNDKLVGFRYYKDKVQGGMMNQIKILEIENNIITVGLRDRGLAAAIFKIKNKD